MTELDRNLESRLDPDLANGSASPLPSQSEINGTGETDETTETAKITETTETTKPPRPKVLAKPLYLVTAVSAMGYGSVVTLFADFRDDYGFTGTGIGMLAAAGFIAGFFSQLFLSKYADRGYARFMVRFGLSVDLAALIWMGFTSNIWQFIAARVLLGLGAGLCGPAIRKIAITRDPANMGHNLGRLASLDILGFIMGPVLAGVLAEFFGLSVPFFVMAGIYGLVLLLVWDEDLSCAIQSARRGGQNALRQLLQIPGVLGGLAAAVAFFSAIGAFEVSWALLLDDNGAPTWLIGVSLTIFTAPMIFFAPIGGRVTQRQGALKTILWSQGVGIVCVLAYGWFDFLWVLLGISLVHGVVDAFTLPGLQVAVSTSSPPEHIAAGQGLLNATGLAVAGLLALAGGPIYDWGGPEELYTMTAVLMALALLYVWRCAKHPSAKAGFAPQNAEED